MSAKPPPASAASRQGPDSRVHVTRSRASMASRASGSKLLWSSTTMVAPRYMKVRPK